MKSNLDPRTGKLPEPRSLGAARARYEHVVREVGKIDRQVDDPCVRTKHATEGAYDAWRMAAGRARRHLAEEARQLALWIDAHTEAKLLREARDLLVTLRDDDVEFEPGELAVIARLEAACEGEKSEDHARLARASGRLT